MTDSAALLSEINLVVKQALPGVTQVVRRRIAAGIHAKVKPMLSDKDAEVALLQKYLTEKDRRLAQTEETYRKRVRVAATHVAAMLENEYGKES